VLLEAQTVADLLSETEKDTKWIWYLLIGGIVLCRTDYVDGW